MLRQPGPFAQLSQALEACPVPEYSSVVTDSALHPLRFPLGNWVTLQTLVQSVGAVAQTDPQLLASPLGNPSGAGYEGCPTLVRSFQMSCLLLGACV